MDFYLPESLLNKPINIALIGAGGSGSQIATELFQMDSLLRSLSNGVVYLNLTIYDGDKVSLFNVGRQGFYLGDVGNFKAEVLTNRFNMFGQTQWQCRKEYFNPKNVASLANFDFLITAVDKAKFRVDLGEAFEAVKNTKSNLLWIDVGNGRNDGQLVLGHAFSAKNGQLKLPNIYDLYGSMLKNIDESAEDEPSCSTQQALEKQDFGVNRAVSAQATQLIWQLLRYGKISHHGSFIDVLLGTVQPLKIDPNQWAIYGYQTTPMES
ncbi:PRTRC system ThiF family protein [Shewanella aestuarii]|uniref:PRTRC system ThiF family protein n=1 Tax=Shewanella aestuarii TaxID=1028752 RepID=A0A6G9QQT5_9GAMM|nr:PRTRC system ThiF family protein [Shewanella aestuarii]QIR16463.1 PRTRC system ThiF family protein [Shewanella aestuarii]